MDEYINELELIEFLPDEDSGEDEEEEEFKHE